MNLIVGNGKSINSPEDHLAGMVASGVNLVTSSTYTFAWLIDTGATDHMCCSISLLNNVTKLSKRVNLALPNGSTILVDTIGSFQIHPHLTLDNVFFVPSFKYNLLSVSKWIAATGGSVTFFSEHCEFHVPTSQDVLANGRLISGLFHLEFLKDSVSLNSPIVNSVVSKHKLSALWHMRLGHTSSQVLHKIAVVGSNIVDNCTHQCPICPFSKQTSLPFPLSTSHASHIFDLIHVDLWGPYGHETTHGCRFFLTIVDDHSRNVWTFLLSTKQQVFTQLNFFFAYVENQFQTTVKQIRSDHGTEFFNTSFLTLLLEKGIVH